MLLCTDERYPETFDHWVNTSYQKKIVVSPASTYWYILSQIKFVMYILTIYQYENPVLVHTEYKLFLCFRTDMYQYILGMYWYERF